MSIKQEDLANYYAQKYPLTFAKDFLQKDVSLSSRFQEAWNLAEKAASILKEQFAAKKVVVFGSLTKQSLFTPWSDVDLAVWDVPDDKFYAAVGAVTGLSTDFKVDLVDAKACRDSLRKTIETEGIEI
ncbi:MAG TPA: nucleotidyltransferase domain-containing protein [Clostridia bacterium]|nr:nucleotidyltransferase domain-containing protein [Clostridia bacterium]